MTEHRTITAWGLQPIPPLQAAGPAAGAIQISLFSRILFQRSQPPVCASAVMSTKSKKKIHLAFVFTSPFGEPTSISVADFSAILQDFILHAVGLEPTSTNTLRPEHNPLDRSGKRASQDSKKSKIICIYTEMYTFCRQEMDLHWLNLAYGRSDERSDKERCDCVSTEPSSFNATVVEAREKGLLGTPIVHVRTVDRPVHARSVGETALQQPCRNCLRMLMLRDGGLVSRCVDE